tara:strand:- start:831 stop:1511 length:681 start_codon:yes stop_codon:yes gene_type:complete
MPHRLLIAAGLLFAFVNLSFCSLLPGEEKVKEDGFVSLFDGKTLSGWEGDKNIFQVRRGAIVAGSLEQPIDHNEFLCTTSEYSDFELRLEARLLGEGRNAGIQFRSERIPNHHEVKGFQCDIGEQGAKREKLIWGALYDESRRRKFLVEPDTEQLRPLVKLDGWNSFVIRCQGARIQIWVNGLATVDYTEKEEGIAASGIIGLQIHGGPPAEASYRKIRIRDLSSE